MRGEFSEWGEHIFIVKNLPTNRVFHISLMFIKKKKMSVCKMQKTKNTTRPLMFL